MIATGTRIIHVSPRLVHPIAEINIMRQLTFVPTLLVWLFVSCTGTFKTISADIDRLHRGDRLSIGETFHDVRLKLYKTGRLDFLNTAHSFFMLQTYVLEDGLFYGRIWSKNDSISYSYHAEKFEYNLISPFSTEMTRLIGSWDTTAIRSNERNFGALTHSKNIYGTRVQKNGRKYHLDIIQFSDFTDVSRDSR